MEKKIKTVSKFITTSFSQTAIFHWLWFFFSGSLANFNRVSSKTLF